VCVRCGNLKTRRPGPDLGRSVTDKVKLTFHRLAMNFRGVAGIAFSLNYLSFQLRRTYRKLDSVSIVPTGPLRLP